MSARAPRHHLLLASAGTGKTWRLTGHFLALCFRGVEPSRILATTFTRKAAGEIQDRVFARLAEAVDDERARAELRAQADLDALERGECVALLAGLARGVDRLHVRTLDSFFSHLARLFAFELAMPPDWRIADEREDAELRAEAIGRVLELSSADERLELLRALQRDAGARSVHQTLVRVVKEARAEARDGAEGAWAVVRAPRGLDDERVAALRARLEAWPRPLTQQGKPNQHWQANLARLFECTANGDWQGLLQVGLVEKVLAGEATFARLAITDELRELIDELAHHAGALEIAALVRRNAAAHAFLGRYELACAELQRERGIYRFDDLPPALVALGERREELWYRLDARIDHLLLDEFQDTAPLQWRVLAPFAAELAAYSTGEKSFFCVGDVKQSIYGWRSAEPRLLAGLASRLPGLAAEPMDASWRSSPVVLDAVDRVFAGIARSTVLAGDELAPLRAAAERWCGGYRPHVAARPERPGAVLLYEAPRAREGERPDLPPLRKAVERIAALRAESPDMRIGLLVRRNAHIPWLIERLRERGVLASGEGGNALTDSDAVSCFLSVLHLADHPGDGAAAFHVASSPFGALLGLSLESFERERAAVSRTLRARLLREGFGGLASSLSSAVDAARERWGEWDRRRYARLIDLASGFDARGSLRATAFARHVRETRVEEPSAAGVRVMTVHAAKGLEFETVVLPELDLALCSGRHALLVRRTDPYGAIDAITLPPRKALVRFDPLLAALREEAQARDLEESLSVLYVAMTRAARRLELVVCHPETRGRGGPTTFAALLRAAFPLGEPDELGVIWRHERSSDERGWCAPKAAREEAAEAGEPVIELLPTAPPSAAWTRSPSAEEGRGARARELLRARDGRATRFGILVHRWLEEVEWIDDFERTDEELLALGALVEPDLELRREALRFLRAALARDELRAALLRPRSGSTLQVERERAFSVFLTGDAGEGETLWTGAIDRLVLAREGTRVVAAEVLDYKTDRVEGGELARRLEFYRPQLEAYRRVAARIAGIEPTAVRARLAFLHAGRVLEA